MVCPNDCRHFGHHRDRLTRAWLENPPSTSDLSPGAIHVLANRANRFEGELSIFEFQVRVLGDPFPFGLPTI
jgi:hypothetical protein